MAPCGIFFFLTGEESGGQWLLWPGLSLVWLAGSRWSYDKARGISYWQSYVGGVGTHLAHKKSNLRYTLIPLHSLVNTDTLFCGERLLWKSMTEGVFFIGYDVVIIMLR